MADLTYAEISKLLKYEPDTGKLFWLPRPFEMFSSKRIANSWNSTFASKEAFLYYNGCGYRYGTVCYKKYRAHRVAWILHHKAWPDGQVDHINGIRDDNRIMNLRVVDNKGNGRNQKKRNTNTSGATGVSLDKRRGTWRAWINDEGRHKYLGEFRNFDDAIAKRKTAEVELGYHPNHGR